MVAGLGVPGQGEAAFKEKQNSRGDFLTRRKRREGILFQEEARQKSHLERERGFSE